MVFPSPPHCQPSIRNLPLKIQNVRAAAKQPIGRIERGVLFAPNPLFRQGKIPMKLFDGNTSQFSRIDFTGCFPLHACCLSAFRSRNYWCFQSSESSSDDPYAPTSSRKESGASAFRMDSFDVSWPFEEEQPVFVVPEAPVVLILDDSSSPLLAIDTTPLLLKSLRVVLGIAVGREHGDEEEILSGVDVREGRSSRGLPEATRLGFEDATRSGSDDATTSGAVLLEDFSRLHLRLPLRLASLRRCELESKIDDFLTLDRLERSFTEALP